MSERERERSNNQVTTCDCHWKCLESVKWTTNLAFCRLLFPENYKTSLTCREHGSFQTDYDPRPAFIIITWLPIERSTHIGHMGIQCAALWGEPLEPLSVRRLSDVSGTDCIGRFESPQHDGNHDDPLWNYDTISSFYHFLCGVHVLNHYRTKWSIFFLSYLNIKRDSFWGREVALKIWSEVMLPHALLL
jgi:hypothetical protein